MCRNLVFFFIVSVFSFSGVILAEEMPPFSIEAIKAALAERTISQGPDSSMLTRSSWGPEMYRKTVDAVVMILLLGEVPSEDVTGSGIIVDPTGVIITNWRRIPTIIMRLFRVFWRKLIACNWKCGNTSVSILRN